MANLRPQKYDPRPKKFRILILEIAFPMTKITESFGLMAHFCDPKIGMGSHFDPDN